MSESQVDTEITCPGCRQRVPEAQGATGIVACPNCKTSFVPQGLSIITVQLNSKGGTAGAGTLELPQEFRERYDLGRVLGRGGMGTVFLAVDRKSGQEVAVKLLTAIESGPVLTRFLQEGKLALDIDHPNVMKVFEIAEIGGHPYIVSEVLAGGSLRARMKDANGPMPLADCIKITLDILGGLHAVHSRGIIHRDIKPDNVLFATDGTAKLVDFGIAKDQGAQHRMTQTGELLGTPQYMAPEQIRGQTVTRATDLYSVGVVFYEMLTGRPPFLAKDVFELMMHHVSKRPPAVDTLVPGMPEEVSMLLNRVLAKEPKGRPADAEQMMMALRLCPTELRFTTPPPPPAGDGAAAAADPGGGTPGADASSAGAAPPGVADEPFNAPVDRTPLIMVLLLLFAMGAAGFCQHMIRKSGSGGGGTPSVAPASAAASAAAPGASPGAP